MTCHDVRAWLGGAMLATLALAASPAAAKPTTYAFSGSLASAGLFAGSSNPDWAFAEGQAFRGTLVYDPDAVTSSYDYIDTPERTLTFHNSPIVSFGYEIDTPAGTFAYAPPASGSYAAVSVSQDAGDWTGVDLRWQNYPIDGVPQTAVPASGYVGAYYAHSSFLTLLDYASRPLATTSADVDLAALFAAITSSDYAFSVRFSDPALWEPGIEHLDGIIGGRIDRFVAVDAAAVPEPATWATLILGCGATGGTLRVRRRRNRLAA